MRDVDVTPQTIVNLDMNRVLIEDFKGTLDPPMLSGKLSADTKNFEIFDRSVHDPAKKHMLGVPRARLTGTFGVHEGSVRFDDMRAEFGKSVLPRPSTSASTTRSRSPCPRAPCSSSPT